jgi:anthranilate synthase
MMRAFNAPLKLYNFYQECNLKPALLEWESYTFLGINPTCVLEIKNNKLYQNEKIIGHALDIFKYFDMQYNNKSENTGQRDIFLKKNSECLSNGKFFPAWIGFFSYEFAQYLGLPTKKGSREFPEAYFAYYENGLVWKNSRLNINASDYLVESIKLQDLPLPNCFEQCINNNIIKSNLTDKEYLFAVKEIKDKISRGCFYQVNFSKRFEFDATNQNPLWLYYRMKQKNCAKFMGLMNNQDWGIISMSPERLFSLKNNIITTRPIAGTAKRGANKTEDLKIMQTFLKSKKECAEHAMMVDMARNDLAKVSLPGSVYISECYSVEFYQYVMHLVSEVCAKTIAPLKDIFASLFPGASITGAPKESVMQAVKSLETVPRGFYTGSLGFISGNFGIDFNMLIRSCSIINKVGYYHAGGGIVYNSNPLKEHLEVKQKSLGFTNAISNKVNSKSKKNTIIKGSIWKYNLPKFKSNAKVLFIENHDSFSYNIIDCLKILGAQVEVIDNETKINLSSFANIFSHIIVGPGPNSPKEAGQTLDWVTHSIKHKIPFLGICLGHQALGEALGAKLIKAQRPIHGEAHYIYHNKNGIFKNINSPARYTRYHSLILTDIPNCIEVSAKTKSGLVMGIKHKNLPLFGVQFHPESFLSESGLDLLNNFLQINL